MWSCHWPFPGSHHTFKPSLQTLERQAVGKYKSLSLAEGSVSPSSSPLGAGFFFMTKKDKTQHISRSIQGDFGLIDNLIKWCLKMHVELFCFCLLGKHPKHLSVHWQTQASVQPVASGTSTEQILCKTKENHALSLFWFLMYLFSSGQVKLCPIKNGLPGVVSLLYSETAALLEINLLQEPTPLTHLISTKSPFEFLCPISRFKQEFTSAPVLKQEFIMELDAPEPGVVPELSQRDLGIQNLWMPSPPVIYEVKRTVM